MAIKEPSDETINPSARSDNKVTPLIDYYYGGKVRVNLIKVVSNS